MLPECSKTTAPVLRRMVDLPAFSFILPAHNEESNIVPLAQRIVRIADALGRRYEIVWVDDGSTDRTAELLDKLSADSPVHQPLYLSRNFGHMSALTAGLEAARATEAVVCLDADGQHPPELIPDMIRLWEEGADIVQTLRHSTVGESGFKRLSSSLFYGLLKRLSNLELPPGAADFRLLDRQVVDALNSLPERARFVRGLVHWVGFQTDYLPYEAPARLGGVSKYRFGSMLRLALNGITSFSIRPLRLIFLLGMVVLVLAVLYACYALTAFVLGWPLVPGWTSLMLVTLFLSGIQLLTLGVASEYLGRIYDEVKSRPVYISRKPRHKSPQRVRISRTLP